MKKMIFLFFAIAGAMNLHAQSGHSGLSGLKYLPANKADSYINFLVVADDDHITINMSSFKNVQDYTFYLLKDEVSANGQESWSILKSYTNVSANFRKTYNDKATAGKSIMYRIMAVDKNENIEYTPIRCLNKQSVDITEFASND